MATYCRRACIPSSLTPAALAAIGLVNYANACAALELAPGNVGLDARILLSLQMNEWTARDDLMTTLGKRVKATELDEALGLLAKQVTSRTIPTDGRPRTEYRRVR